MIGAILTGAGLAAQIFGAIKGGRSADNSQKLLDEQFQENQSFYNNNAKQTFLDTNAAKGIFERMRKNLLQTNKTIDSNAAATGATAEATIASKSKVQENYNDMVSNIAGQGTQYQQNQEAIYRGQKNQLTNQQMGINEQKTQNAANLAGNAADMVTGAANILSPDLNGTASQLGISDYNRGRLDAIAQTKVKKEPFRV